MESPAHRRRAPLVAAMAVLAAAAVAITVLAAANAHGGAALRKEAEEAILLADMEAGLGATAALVSAMVRSPRGHDVPMADMPPPRHPDLEDHPDLVASLAVFTAAASKLRPLLDEENQSRLDRMMVTHDQFSVSVERLHEFETAEGDELTALYRGATEKLETEVRDRLSTMRRDEADEIQAAVAGSQRAETITLWLVPVAFVLALVIAAYALRLQTHWRRITIRDLRRSNAAKNEFLATVSHELRTPLTAVLGFIEVLGRDGDSLPWEERQTMLNLASREAWELNNLVEDLLVMARADAGTLSTADVRVDLNAQASQVLEALSGGQRVLHGNAGPVPAQGDPARVRQIVRNLVTNAFRYGGEHVRIRAEAIDGRPRLQVIDDGGPIPMEQRQQIFEAYHRVDPGSSPTGSVGLGLAVSRQLARTMGGDLTYHYHEGHSVFELTLPPPTSPPTAEQKSLATAAV